MKFRKLLVAVTALTLAALTVGVGGQSATAAPAKTLIANHSVPREKTVTPNYAEGYTFFGKHTILGHTVIGGEYDVTVDGSGLNVVDVKSSFETISGTVCNWRMGIVFRTSSGALEGSIPGATHNSCNFVGQDLWYNYILTRLTSGTVCSTLYDNSTSLATVCESIHP